MNDDQEIAILSELRKDARQGVQKIAKKLSLSESTVQRKITKFREKGTIKHFTIVPDWKKLQKTTLAYVLVNVDNKYIKRKNLRQDDVADTLKQHPFIFDCATLTGRHDLILKIRVKDNHELNEFINWLRGKEGVLQTETLVVLYESEKEDNPFDKAKF